jgi:hypothetical protein
LFPKNFGKFLDTMSLTWIMPEEDHPDSPELRLQARMILGFPEDNCLAATPTGIIQKLSCRPTSDSNPRDK